MDEKRDPYGDDCKDLTRREFACSRKWTQPVPTPNMVENVRIIGHIQLVELLCARVLRVCDIITSGLGELTSLVVMYS